MTATMTRYDFPTLIDGRAVMGEARFEVRFPYTGEVIGSAPKLSRGQVSDVLETASTKRFDLTRHERAQVLNRIAEELERTADNFARLITSESGLCLKD